MKWLFGILAFIAILLGAAYFTRSMFVSAIYPTKTIFTQGYGLVPSSAAVKEYNISEPSELLFQFSHDGGPEGIVVIVAQADPDLEWTTTPETPLPIRFVTAPGRFSSAWVDARANETFRVIVYRESNDDAPDASLLSMQVLRRPVLPDWVRLVYPEVDKVEGRQLIVPKVGEEIDSETIMNYVSSMDN